MTSKITQCAAAVVLGLAGCGGAAAQAYPAKPIRLIVPYPAGGGSDLMARPMAQKLNEKWGQSVLVDNRGVQRA